MRNSAILAGVLLLAGSGLMFAGGFEALREGAVLNRAAPEAIRSIEVRLPEQVRAGLEGGGAGILSKGPAGAVIRLAIKSDNELVASGGASYLATKDSIFCKTFSWNEGSAGMVPKTIYPEFKPQNNRITIPAALDSACDFERVGGASLSFSIPGRAEPYNSVLVFTGAGGSGEQKIVCEIILASTPGGRKEMVNCAGHVTLDANNQATVRVVKK